MTDTNEDKRIGAWTCPKCGASPGLSGSLQHNCPFDGTNEDRFEAIIRRWREKIGVCAENRKPVLCEDSLGLYVPTQLIADMEFFIEEVRELAEAKGALEVENAELRCLIQEFIGAKAIADRIILPFCDANDKSALRDISRIYKGISDDLPKELNSDYDSLLDNNTELLKEVSELKQKLEEVEELKGIALLWSWRAEYLRKLYTEAAKDGGLSWDKIDKVMAEDN